MGVGSGGGVVEDAGVGACVAVEVGDWTGAVTATTTAAGAFVGVGSGAFREVLAGVVGVGRGVLVAVGAGASVESSPQATRASKMIAETASATGIMYSRLRFQEAWTGRPAVARYRNPPIRVRVSLPR